MNEHINVTLTRDEALVLFEFFARFDEDDNFTLKHTAEYLAFMKISAQLDSSLVEPLQPQYLNLLREARERIAAGYEGKAPGVCDDVA
jgi:hypothetical protein